MFVGTVVEAVVLVDISKRFESFAVGGVGVVEREGGVRVEVRGGGVGERLRVLLVGCLLAGGEGVEQTDISESFCGDCEGVVLEASLKDFRRDGERAAGEGVRLRFSATLMPVFKHYFNTVCLVFIC